MIWQDPMSILYTSDMYLQKYRVVIMLLYDICILHRRLWKNVGTYIVVNS